MKVENLGSKLIAFIVAGVFTFFVDIYFAHWAYRDYEVIVRGILGITVFVLFFRYILIKGSQISSDNEAVKFMLICVYFAIVVYWASREVIATIIYLVRLF